MAELSGTPSARSPLLSVPAKNGRGHTTPVRLHHIKIGPRIIDITELASAPTVAPASGRTLFAIGLRGEVRVFRDWAPFVAALSEQLSGGAKAKVFYAAGRWEIGGDTLTANYVAVALTRP